MAILYVFTAKDPNNAGFFPPSVVESAWLKSLNEYNNENAFAVSDNHTIILFDDESALNSYIATYRCTDASLLADIASWKSTHGISYISQYFTLTSAGISPSPIVS